MLDPTSKLPELQPLPVGLRKKKGGTLEQGLIYVKQEKAGGTLEQGSIHVKQEKEGGTLEQGLRRERRYTGTKLNLCEDAG